MASSDPAPGSPRIGRAALVARDAECAALRQALAESRAATRLVFVSGEPGIGKSRLLQELAAEAADRLVLRGGAYEAQGLPPYVLFVELFRAHLEQGGSNGVERLGELTRLLPEYTPSATVGSLAVGDRQRLMEQAAVFFRGLAVDRPLLLVLDDLQWADPASIELLVYLRRRLRAAPLLVLAAYRDTDVDDEHPLAAALAELQRTRLADELRLRRLRQAETAELLAELLGGPAVEALAAVVHQRSEGNPFFVEELVRGLSENGLPRDDRGGVPFAGPDRPSLEQTPLTPGLRGALHARLGCLSQRSRMLLEAAGVLGRRFELPLVAAVEELAEEAAVDLLGEAVRRQVLRPSGAGYEFCHDLLRAALDLQLNPLRRRLLHDRAAAAYERLGLAGQRPAEVAYHLLRGSEPAHARPFSALAGERALAAFAFADAADHLRMAVELLREHGPAAELPRLLARRGEALVGAGRYDEALAVYHEALSLADAERELELIGHLHGRVGDVYLAREEVDLAVAAYRRALAAFGAADHPEAARALLQLAELHLVALSRHDEGARLARRALAAARRLGRSDLLAEARGLLGTAEVRMGRPSGVRTLRRALDEALASAARGAAGRHGRQPARPASLLGGRIGRGGAGLRAGARAAARGVRPAPARLADVLGRPGGLHPRPVAAGRGAGRRADRAR